MRPARLKMSRCCPIVELRRYTLHPGKREALITLFEREFIETQEDAGMQLIAQFRDLDQPDVGAQMRRIQSRILNQPTPVASTAHHHGMDQAGGAEARGTAGADVVSDLAES